jgi:processive 1,2-diacylglycerol beta-glucosyltransferase
MIVDIAKVRYGLSAKFITVETDFVMHPCAEETLHADRLVVACEGLASAAQAKGFAPEQILPIGIPIRSKFASSLPKAEARRALGLAVNAPTLLVMGGSMGHGNMLESLQEIDGLPFPLQIVVICGNNHQQKEKIDNQTWQKNVFCLGFVHNVDVYMDAADLILSKPGGLTTSEALAKRLPMLMRNPIDGQEKRNVEFLLETGAARFVDEKESVAKQVNAFFSDPALAEEMLSAVEKIRKPYSTEHLCDEMERLAAL